MTDPADDTVLPVRGASPYDVVVGRDLGRHLDRCSAPPSSAWP